MLLGLPPEPPVTSTPAATPSLTPLILFAASPGTITGVITLSVAHAKSGIPVTALVAAAVATAVMWLLIVLVARLGRTGSVGFVHDTVTRFMGLIVIAMGVQFAFVGSAIVHARTRSCRATSQCRRSRPDPNFCCASRGSNILPGKLRAGNNRRPV
jgi:hypothetical protein